MKIITLNTWGGRAGKEKLLSFFERYKESTDIFCLQEIWRAGYEDLPGVDQANVMTQGLQEISQVLGSEFKAFFHPHHKEDYGLALFVRDTINFLEIGEKFVHSYKEFVPDDNAGKHARNIQFVKVGKGENQTLVINFHGLWNGKGKEDSEDRLLQSRNILKFLEKQNEKRVVLCGDFNLLPETQSLTLLENFGLVNLVKKYNISSTRTSYYTKPEKFADYILVSQDIEVINFMVLPEEVSDHAALLVEIK